METFRVLLPDIIRDEAFRDLMLAQGAHSPKGPGRSYCWQRQDAAVYLSLERESESDLDLGSFERLQGQLPWLPRSQVLVTVSRRDGSVFLAFEMARVVARRWNGFIDWAGLDQWKEWFDAWSRANPGES